MSDPCDPPRNRRYRRHFRAALTIYLAVLTYRRISAVDRDRVSEWIREYIDGPSNAVITYLEFEMFFQTSSKAAFWAIAMRSLGIEPALEGERWPLPNLRFWWNRLWAVDRLLLAYHPFTAVTDDVEKYLVAKGVDAASLGLRAEGPDADRRRVPRDADVAESRDDGHH